MTTCFLGNEADIVWSFCLKEPKICNGSFCLRRTMLVVQRNCPKWNEYPFWNSTSAYQKLIYESKLLSTNLNGMSKECMSWSWRVYFFKKTLLIKTESSPRKRQRVLCLYHNTICTQSFDFSMTSPTSCVKTYNCMAVQSLSRVWSVTPRSTLGSSVLHCLLWVTLRWFRSEVKVAQLCPTFCNPMDYAVHVILHVRILEWVAFLLHRLLELFKFRSIESVMLYNALILSLLLLLLPWIFFSIQVLSNELALGQSIGASASASVLSMNIQGWFPLGYTFIFLGLPSWLSW